ncbi:MAG: L,D-transpeptidase family protein [Eubacterium sp.]|nr:L,D-transpeptidase family protein [Eubacterium sp.]
MSENKNGSAAPLPDSNEEASGSQKKPAKTRSNKLKYLLLIMIAALIAFAIYAYVSYAQQFKTVFYKGTVINGIDASFRTPEDVEKEIADKAEDYQISLQFREDAKETIPGDEIDYHYVSDGSVQKLMEDQHFLLWPKGQFGSQDETVSVATAFDEQKLADKLTALPEYQEDNMVAPKNARVRFKKKKFKILKERYGTTLDPEIVTAAVKDAVSASKTTLDVDSVADAYQNPTVFSDDQLLADQCYELNELACASITWQLPGGEETLNGNTLRKWLIKDDDGHYSKDEEVWEAKLEEYVEKMAEDVKTLGEDHHFQATDLGDMTVKSDTYGWRMDYETELAQTREELASGTITTREPNWLSTEMYTENWGFGPNYIECDLSRQHMWVYQNNELYMDSDIVSGTMVYSRYTPSGIYFLSWKERDHVLTGPRNEDGEPEYETPCDYWMPFNGNIGFHDAWWRGAFGGDIYYYSGSHGCINMPSEAAGQLFSVISTEMPIVIYYSQGCELEQ